MFTKISIEDLDSIYSGDENKLIDHVYYVHNINYANKQLLREIPKEPTLSSTKPTAGEIEQYQKALVIFNASISERKNIAEDCRNVCADNLNVLKNWVAEEYGMTKVLTEEQIDTIFDWSDNQCNNTSERFNMVLEAFDLIKRMKFIK